MQPYEPGEKYLTSMSGRSPLLLFVGLFFTTMGVVIVAIGVNSFFWRGGDIKAYVARQETTSAELGKQNVSKTRAAAEVSIPKPPSFEIARVDPNGNAFIAGMAAPGSTVTILDGGKEIAAVIATERGDWVFMPDQPPLPGEHRLSLEMRIKDMEPVASLDTIAMVVPEKNKDTAASESKPVLQNQALGIDTVDYGNSGKLFISGHGLANEVLQVYLDKTLIDSTITGENGKWTITPDSVVVPGVYALRVDQVDASGKVLARAEIPFSRAEPIKEKPGSTTIIVQPGNSLWQIARGEYGEGMQAAIIYKANKKQINDPNLIYPGQVFTLPSSR